MKKRYVCECGWSAWLNLDGTEYCSFCDRKVRGMTLIVHPDPAVRDPYGLLSRDNIREVCRYAEVWKSGWDDCAQLHNTPHSKGIRFAHYVDVRDYLFGLVDLPRELVYQLALWITRENASILDPFNPVL